MFLYDVTRILRLIHDIIYYTYIIQPGAAAVAAGGLERRAGARADALLAGAPFAQVAALSEELRGA